MKISRIALFSLVGLLAPIAAHAGTCPSYGAATDCNFVITFNADGSVSTGGPGGNYDGSDDTLVGVINNTNAAISNFNLSSSLDIFGFDGDGIDTFGAPSNPTDLAAGTAGGYGGPNAYFTNISPDFTSGTVDFINPVAANGGTDYFSLEDQIDVSAPPVVTGGGATAPEPSSLILLGTGALSAFGAMRRRLKV